MHAATRPSVDAALLWGEDVRAPEDVEPGAPGADEDQAHGRPGGGAGRRADDRSGEREDAGARLDEGAGTGSSARAQGRARVLVIEDEPGIVDFLRRGLEGEGFAVEEALEGIEGERLALSRDVDAVVLDLLLPGRGGLEVLAAIRKARPRLPVLVLTARAELEDRVAGLDAGAVDYLVKPISIAELAARLRAQLRVRAEAGTTLRGDGIEVELLTRTVRRDDEPVSLSSTEFDLLVYMLRNQGEVLSREQLLRGVWGEGRPRDTNVVDVYIGYLRRKLAGPGGVSPISTVRAAGYRFGAAG
jgi:DNA-binding response OmpR family regulator